MTKLFLIIEYCGIPIALLLYGWIIKQLSNSDPLGYKEEMSIWSYGLELMVISSVSTFLFGISFLGHSDMSGISTITQWIIIICLFLSILEFFILTVVTFKVRAWGDCHPNSKVYSNLFAFIFQMVLVLIIIIKPSITENNNHSAIPTKMGLTEIYYSPTFYTTVLIVSILCIVIIVVTFANKKIRKIAISEYSKGAKLINNNPTFAIANLKKSLRKIPENSTLVIDISMKLSRVYHSLGDTDKAIEQIDIMFQKSAFMNMPPSYLKDCIIKQFIIYLVEDTQLDRAEQFIDQILSQHIANELKILLLEARKKRV